jgi:nucleoside phosphorylase
MSDSLHTDVLIMTVTCAESRAVLAAFEAATGQKATPVTIGDKVYRAYVWIVLLVGMSAGKAIAALRPGAVIMVGIAFGINEQKQKLGDILVSRQLMLYDVQRVSATQIVPRGDRPHASARLLDYLTSAELDWSGAHVRFGLLLTGEKLVDNVDYRDQLRKLEVEAIGGEMEGAGVYAACQDARVDWVLVKSICDWADGNKAQDKDERQQQAAKNAADFVVHALRHAKLQRPAHASTPQAASTSAGQHQEVGSIVVSGSGNSVVVQQGGTAGATNLAEPKRNPARPGKRMPTCASLRALLGEVLRTASDLQSFFIDWFPDVSSQVGGGMPRNACEDLLLQKHDTDEVLSLLRKHDGQRVERYESVLEWEVR